MNKNEGLITIKLEGVTFEETERCRQLIETLFIHGALHARNGSVIMHFDHEGVLQEIEMHVKKWRRNKPTTPLAKLYESAKIEILK